MATPLPPFRTPPPFPPLLRHPCWAPPSLLQPQPFVSSSSTILLWGKTKDIGGPFEGPGARCFMRPASSASHFMTYPAIFMASS